jgi:tryptophanyl-tRNA synthetase
VKGLETRPEADNLVGIYAGLADTTKEAVLRDFGNASFSKFKDALAELASSRLTPIGDEMRRLMADPAEIDRILAEGAARAHAIAAPILAKTKDIVGFIRS